MAAESSFAGKVLLASAREHLDDLATRTDLSAEVLNFEIKVACNLVATADHFINGEPERDHTEQ